MAKAFYCRIDEVEEIDDQGLGSPDPDCQYYNPNYEDELAQRYAEALLTILEDGVPLSVKMYEKGCPKTKEGEPYEKDCVYGQSA